MTKVLFCWSDISGYMAACWKALQANHRIDFHVIAFQAKTETAFADNLMQGVPCTLLNLEERNDAKYVAELVQSHQADIIVLPGWFHVPYRKLAFNAGLKSSTFIMCMDTPYWGTIRQKIAPLLLKRFLSRITHIVVSGERSWQYTRRLGFDTSHVSRGQYGVDVRFFSQSIAQRDSIWPKRFLFIGRYSKEKAIDILVAAYQNYRAVVGKDNAWELLCCGKGEQAFLLENVDGIINKGFVQPDSMDKIFASAGALVLPSRFDPWPLTIVEACAAGLPVIATEVCGSTVELLRNHYNGLLIAEDNIQALSDALTSCHHCYEELPVWGKRSSELAQAYSAENWAIRWENLLKIYLHN